MSFAIQVLYRELYHGVNRPDKEVLKKLARTLHPRVCVPLDKPAPWSGLLGCLTSPSHSARMCLVADRIERLLSRDPLAKGSGIRYSGGASRGKIRRMASGKLRPFLIRDI